MICEGQGKSDEWYTPKSIFDALGLTFDLDPCSSGRDYVPAHRRYTKVDNVAAVFLHVDRPRHAGPTFWISSPGRYKDAEIGTLLERLIEEVNTALR